MGWEKEGSITVVKVVDSKSSDIPYLDKIKKLKEEIALLNVERQKVSDEITDKKRVFDVEMEQFRKRMLLENSEFLSLKIDLNKERTEYETLKKKNETEHTAKIEKEQGEIDKQKILLLQEKNRIDALNDYILKKEKFLSDKETDISNKIEKYELLLKKLEEKQKEINYSAMAVSKTCDEKTQILEELEKEEDVIKIKRQELLIEQGILSELIKENNNVINKLREIQDKIKLDTLDNETQRDRLKQKELNIVDRENKCISKEMALEIIEREQKEIKKNLDIRDKYLRDKNG